MMGTLFFGLIYLGLPEVDYLHILKESKDNSVMWKLYEMGR